MRRFSVPSVGWMSTPLSHRFSRQQAHCGGSWYLRSSSDEPHECPTLHAILAATHTRSVHVFRPGTTATPQLRELAEDGNTAPLTAMLTGMPAGVSDVSSTAGLLTRGASVSFEVTGGGGFDVLSLSAMLIPTNDAFFGLETTAA